MNRRPLIRAAIAGLLFASALATEQAMAQDIYPAKPIKVVLPIPAGTALDVVMRVIAEDMSRNLGQPVVVESRPGAGGLLAAQAVAASPADGYTLLGGAAGIFTILPAQHEKLPIDLERDFTHVGMVLGRGVMFIAVPPNLGVNNFAEFVSLTKAKPGEIVIGTNGAGTLPHYAGLLLQRKAGLPINLVPYNQGGTPAVVADILGGRVHATIEATAGLRGQLQSGNLKLIGAMSSDRDPDFPAVPTVAETLPGLSAVGFMTLAAPAKTPEPIIRRLNKSLNQALASAPVRQRFAELGVPISIVSPAQASAFVAEQRQIWLPLVKELDNR